MLKTILMCVLALLAAACGGTVEQTVLDCQSASQADGGTDADQPAGNGSCDDGTYTWGDPVLHICAMPLPTTRLKTLEVAAAVAVFEFTNYRSFWNHLDRICVRNVGPTPLDRVNIVRFDWVNWTLPFVDVHPPWPTDGRICAEVPQTIGVWDRQTLTVSIQFTFPNGPSIGDSYRFEIPDRAAIVFDDDNTEQVVPDFPIQSETVTVVFQE